MSHQKGAFRTARMLPVATELCQPGVIDDHVPDFIGSVLLAEKVAGESPCRNFLQMFVLRDGKDFLLGQAAEREAIFERDHRPKLCFGLSQATAHARRKRKAR